MVSTGDTAISLHIRAPDQLKLKVPRSAQIFIFGKGRGDRRVLQTNIPEILEWEHSRNFEPKFLATGMCSASQLVSHILRMWRLNEHISEDLVYHLDFIRVYFCYKETT